MKNDVALGKDITPMMSQYLSIKKNHTDYLLFYRMGDFYELFFEDAIIASKVLDIILTKRGKLESQNIPMCGVPFHASEVYLAKLIKANYKIAICEQLETPEEAKKRGYKEVVRREVVRIITPGTITEENLLEAKSLNYLCSITKSDNDYGIAWIDLSTGEFFYCLSSKDSLILDLTRIDPKEILISDSLFNSEELSDILFDYKSKITTHVASFFDYKRAEIRLKSYYNIHTLDVFELSTKATISACGSIIEYIHLTQKNNVPHLGIPEKLKTHCFMNLDPATKKSLELNVSLSGERKNSLLHVMDRTFTNAGGRLLKHYIASPLVDAEAINKRLNKVQFFIENNNLREKLSDILKNIGDIERATLRLIMGRGGPRDLNLIKNGLSDAFSMIELFEYSGIDLPKEIQDLISDLTGHESLIQELKEAVKDEVSLLAREGNFIKYTYHPKLTELHEIQQDTKAKLEELRDKYRKETGINNLKIEQNNVIGYYIEVSPQSSSKIQDSKFIHRQTLITGIRYVTIELKELETSIIRAKEFMLRLELQIFSDLTSQIDSLKEKILITSHAIANIDLSIGFASLAVSMNYTRPIIDNSLTFTIKSGRHPVVENSFLQEKKHNFIANDSDLNEGHNLWLLTGPNMAGKSTYLRQNAIIAIMAQMGSYVPANHAHIGIIDKIFSRVGASDDLAHGRSTFMVEMVETATILTQATNKSLLILDEIGRGTSTYDGLSIAWACIEYIHNKIRARTIFATHYHELTNLTKDLESLVCYSMKIKEWEDKIIFMHEIVKGSANKSYGIHVANIAGIPNLVIERAREILQMLEMSKDNNQEIKIAVKTESVIEEELKQINVNNLTPMQAIETLYRLKGLLRELK